jgi:hypothetical protein
MTTPIQPACTLPIAERPLRLADFEAVFTTVHTIERTAETEARLLMTGGTGLAQRTQDLADAETACCSFFTFAVTETTPGNVALDVVVPPEHADVLTGLLELAR